MLITFLSASTGFNTMEAALLDCPDKASLRPPRFSGTIAEMVPSTSLGCPFSQ
jgi:hypothetical protein